MKTILIALAMVVCVVNSSLAQPPMIITHDGKYLGNLSTNPFDPNSVNNPFGQYGDPYSPDSINNPYGRYGSPYSNESVNNPYSINGPPPIQQRGSRY